MSTMALPSCDIVGAGTVTAADDGIRGKDYLLVTNGIITVQALTCTAIGAWLVTRPEA